MKRRSDRPAWARRFEAEAGRIIVADADASVFVLTRQLTAPDRFAVESAETPDALRQGLRRGPVELAVVNVAMLEASPELAEELTNRSRRGLKVIVTNDAHDESTERCARAVSPVHYSPKPMSVSMFKDVIESALRPTVQV